MKQNRNTSTCARYDIFLVITALTVIPMQDWCMDDVALLPVVLSQAPTRVVRAFRAMFAYVALSKFAISSPFSSVD